MLTRALILAALAASLSGCAHSRIPGLTDPEYRSLLPYEGLYEYENDFTLQLAASPKEKILFAIIGGARSPLRAAGPDTFTDPQKQRVVFQRSSGRVIGYSLPDGSPGRVFRRLGSGSPLSAEAWYPRLPSRADYRYTMPRDRKDGLRVGSLDGSGLDPARIEALVQGIARGDYPDVHSVLVVKNGALVLEEYFYEYNADTLHPLRSATKSVVSALAGVAIDNRLLAGVHEPVLPHFEPRYGRIENVTDAKRRITVEHLLTNSSGLDCNDYDPKSAGNESLMGRTDDWVKFILDLPMIEEPGGAARYCSGGVITTGRIIEKVSGMPLEAFARRHLFEPLGIRTFEWRFKPDRSSSESFCQLSLRPRDMAKFGLLFLHGGQWNGRRVLSKEWVEASTRPHTVVDNTDYGYFWWRPYLDVGGRRHHAILATGNGGQKIYLWPELDMVVVLTGGNYNRQSPAKELLTRYILPAA